MKISKVIRCSCNWLHIAQGPISCWVCQDSISFENWQTGKVSKMLAKPRNPGKAVEIDGTVRLYPEDLRDRVKDGGSRDMGWPDEIGFGKEDRDMLLFYPQNKEGFTVINHRYGL